MGSWVANVNFSFGHSKSGRTQICFVIVYKNGSLIINDLRIVQKLRLKIWKFSLESMKKKQKRNHINGIARRRRHRHRPQHVVGSQNPRPITKPLSNAHTNTNSWLDSAHSWKDSMESVQCGESNKHMFRFFFLTISIRFDCSYYYYHSYIFFSAVFLVLIEFMQNIFGVYFFVRRSSFFFLFKSCVIMRNQKPNRYEKKNTQRFT